jgi:hypothetical protein
MHQGLALTAEHARIASAPVTPALLKPHWSTGWQFGPIAQLDSPLGTNGYLRLEVGVLWRSFTGSDREEIYRGAHLRLLAGMGAAF